jgi:hypothetical protein
MLILILEIAVLCLGARAFFTGQTKFGKRKKLYGGKARAWGLLMMLPLPLTFAIGFVLGLVDASVMADGQVVTHYGLAVETAVIFGCLIAATAIGQAGAVEDQEATPPATSTP